MKKVFAVFVFTLLLLSFMSFGIINAQDDSDNSGSGSDSDNSGSSSEGDSDDDEEDNSGSSSDDEDEIEIEIENEDESDDDSDREFDRTRVRVRERDGEIEREIEREFIDENGNRVRIERRIKIKDGETEIKTRLRIEGEGSNLTVVDANGEVHRIRVTPERLRMLALKRLNATNVTEFSLDEVDDRNVPRVVYKVNSEHNGKFLGVLKMKMRSETQVDPETGEVLEFNVPWWAIFVGDKEIPEEQTIVGNDSVADENLATDEELEEEFSDIGEDTTSDTFLEGEVPENSSDEDNISS